MTARETDNDMMEINLCAPTEIKEKRGPTMAERVEGGQLNREEVGGDCLIAREMILFFFGKLRKGNQGTSGSLTRISSSHNVA